MRGGIEVDRGLRAEVLNNSILVGKSIGELKLAAQMGADIIAIRRDKDWIIDPKETENIKVGDIIIARRAPEGLKEFRELRRKMV
jgi:uncharacterized protein with PhoU and TrkA domain